MVTTPLKLYTLYTVLFHKYGGTNVSVTNCMSHLSMFVPNNATVKLYNGNKRHAQAIGIIFCHFPTCYLIYPVVPVYYCPGYPSNNISPDALNIFVGFQKFAPELLQHCEFLTLKVVLVGQPTRLKTILTTFKSKFVKVNPQRESNIFVPTVCALSKKNLSQPIHQRFGHVYIASLKTG